MSELNKTPIFSFMAIHRIAQEVLLQTPSYTYFFRCVYPEAGLTLPQLAYYVTLENGQRIDITDYHLDGNPRNTLRYRLKVLNLPLEDALKSRHRTG